MGWNEEGGDEACLGLRAGAIAFCKPILTGETNIIPPLNTHTHKHTHARRHAEYKAEAA